MLWWVLRILCEEEWLRLLWSAYMNARRGVRVDGAFNDDFLAQLGLH